MTEQEQNELNRQLRNLVEAQNAGAIPEFYGLNPTQMHLLNSSPLEAGSVVRWCENIGRETLDQVPLLTFAVELMEQLAAKEIKLTAKGNLPGKLVKEWYARGLIGQFDIDAGISKVRGEDDVYFATTLKNVLDIAGLTKKRHGKLSLTTMGKKALAGPRQRLLELIFLTHFRDFNLAYFDGYEDDGTLQMFFGFALVMLLADGKDWKPAKHYGKAMLAAFPMLEQTFAPDRFAEQRGSVISAFTTRFINRSLSFYGLLRSRGDEYSLKNTQEVMATDLFRQLFVLDLSAQRPEQPGDVDKQIRSALFDAEMGSTSWTSNDMPEEMQELFHEQIRAFHSDDPDGKITIGSLIADHNLPDPATLKSDAAAVDEVEKILMGLQEQNVFFQPPMHLSPLRLYKFLVDELFDHEIPTPSHIMPALVPMESVNPELAAPPATQVAAEAFVIAMLSIGTPLPKEIFCKKMRFRGEVVARDVALAHAESWRERWETIVPLSFAPGPVQEADGFTYQLVQVKFEGTDLNGKSKTFEWMGVVQLLESDGRWLTYGASLNGEADFGF